MVRRLQALASSADSCGHSPAFMLSAVGEGCPCAEVRVGGRVRLRVGGGQGSAPKPYPKPLTPNP